MIFFSLNDNTIANSNLFLPGDSDPMVTSMPGPGPAGTRRRSPRINERWVTYPCFLNYLIIRGENCTCPLKALNTLYYAKVFAFHLI